MNKLISEARVTLASMTTAWGDGQRLLSNQMLKTWLEQFAPLQDKYNAMRAAFIADAPAIIADAEMNKGDYDVKPPTLEEINNAFSLEFDIVQIPDSASSMALASALSWKRKCGATSKRASKLPIPGPHVTRLCGWQNRWQSD